MYRKTNRASFLSVQGCSCLAACYGKLVAIELALKDHLGAATTSSAGHNVNSLLGRLAALGTAQAPPISAAALNSNSTKLANKLQVLSCASKTGGRISVPPSNYPYLRYIYHELDGTHLSDVKESDLVEIGAIADQIIQIMDVTYGVAA